MLRVSVSNCNVPIHNSRILRSVPRPVRKVVKELNLRGRYHPSPLGVVFENKRFADAVFESIRLRVGVFESIGFNSTESKCYL
jgi:hypothetical protein